MPIQRVSRGFKDISMTFQSNPLNDDLIALKNANAIARSVRNIVMTIPGERFFQPSFGSGVNRVLFNNMDEISASILEDEIRNSIRNYEPRVRLRSLKVQANFDNNAFDTVVTYDIIGADIPSQQLQFALQSAR
jgi:phage baseplate assembly protein W